MEPEIHWNTGNVGRTCLAAGAQLHLVEPLGFSLDDRRVRRAGLDYWERVAPTLWPSLASFESALPPDASPYLFSAEGERTYWDVAYPDPVTLIFGRESRGLPEAFRSRHRERLLRIPIPGREVRALNLSTAVGLALYEILRQRHDLR